ncbi:MAG: hypothetical protein WC975_16210 [Phycisphaerae bacterium]
MAVISKLLFTDKIRQDEFKKTSRPSWARYKTSIPEKSSNTDIINAFFAQFAAEVDPDVHVV